MAHPPQAYILIIEDDSEIRNMLRFVLSHHDYQVVTCEDGQAALDFLHTAPSPPSLILMDLMMPKMDGWEFRRAQAADAKLVAIPTVVMSATTAAGIARVEPAPDRVMTKPIGMQTLLDLVAMYVGHVSVTR